MLTSFFWNRRGQIGETVTWMVATVAIVVILLIAIFASSFYFEGKNKSVSISGEDFSASVSFFSWLLTEDAEGNNVYEQLKGEEDLNEFNGELAVNIFEGLYGSDYFKTWIGINFKGIGFRENDYFGGRPSGGLWGAGDSVSYGVGKVPLVIERISLNTEKEVEMVLAPSVTGN
ncbi:MAG: hypothetical protein KKB79_02370 [Nanoarchaeota archaeon]|nr:hypothetical protein [Nanoarchaeota archaeon]